MEKLAHDFHTRVKTTLEDEADQTALYNNLKKYKQDNDVASLVNTLKSLLSSPERVALFDDIRPFVSVSQQVEFNNLCPLAPLSKKASLVYLTRHGSDPLGFKFRGGLEHGVGLYISEITPGSQAELKGLKPGDEIIQVNGLNVTQVTHNEALAAMKLKKMLSLKVKGTGLVPFRDSLDDPISWKFVDHKPSPDRSSAYDLPVDPSRNMVAQERTVFVNLEDGQRLGCGISSGRHQPGIFIHKVSPGSLAEKLGFQVGDQVMSVNSTSFQDISHSEALLELKSSKHLNIVLRSWVDGGFQVEPTPAPTRIVDESSPTYATVQKTSLVVQSPTNIVIGQSVLEEESPPTIPIVVQPQPTPQHDQPAWFQKDQYVAFTPRQIDGRELRKVEIVKDGPLDMYLEGGIDSPLGGKLIVAEVIKGGAAERSGQIAKGDQIMMLEGKKMIDIKLEEAQQAFRDHMSGPLDGSQVIRMIIAVAHVKQYEDEVTFF